LKDNKNTLVSHYQRKKIGKVFSLESIASFVRESCGHKFKFQKNVNYFFSIGILRRVLDSFYAIFKQGNINHVMGDIHYIGIFLNSKKTILTIADCVSLVRLKGIKRFIIWFFWYYIPIRRSAKVITISEYVKKEILSYVNCDSDKIEVIHVPILLKIKKIKKKYIGSKPNILHVGSTENKNLSRHVMAIRDIPSTFIFVGEPSKTQLKFIEKNCKDFIIESNLTEKGLLDIYDSCDLLLFASTYEGFGMPIIEAQARGLPVITSNTTSMPEVAGTGACLVDPCSIDEINSAAKKILGDQSYREHLISQGYSNLSRFSKDKIAEKYIRVYTEILNRNT